MTNFDWADIKSLYFIGIGGIGMSAAAGLAKAAGLSVSGSDSGEVYEPSKTVLEQFAIPVHLGYSAKHVQGQNIDAYVVSAGVSRDNPEYLAAQDQSVPILSFSQVLRALAENHYRVVVAGTHGKTTTTALLGQILEQADGSSYMAGGVLQETGLNFAFGDGNAFVFEGDEYRALPDDPTPKFLQYQADGLLLTNLEYDHPDLYESFEHMVDEYRLAIAELPADGLLVYNADDAELAKLAHESNVNGIGFGYEANAEVRLLNLTYLDNGAGMDLEIQIKTKAGVLHESYTTKLVGQMNAMNVLAAVAMARALNIDPEAVSDGVENFQGVKRRLEFVGQCNGAKVFDDYAHHPTAIRETILAIRSAWPDRKVWVVFQPHTLSRTRELLHDFGLAFSEADEVILAPVYSARESNEGAEQLSQELLNEVQMKNKNAQLLENSSDIKQVLQNQLTVNDIVVIMSVGSFHTLAKQLVSE